MGAGETPPSLSERTIMATKKHKTLNVQVKAGHPTGTYGRSGFQFTVLEPLVVETDDLDEESINAILDDEWLVVTDDAGNAVLSERKQGDTQAVEDGIKEAQGKKTSDGLTAAEREASLQNAATHASKGEKV